jgi:hypothetical protein
MANEKTGTEQAKSTSNFTNYAKPMNSGWCEADEQFRQNISNAFPIQLPMHEATAPFSVYQDADGRFCEDDSMPSYDFATPGNVTIYATREEARKIKEALSTGKPIPEDVVDKVAKRTVNMKMAELFSNPMTQFMLGLLEGLGETNSNPNAAKDAEALRKNAERYLG